MNVPYERPVIKTVDGRELMESLGPAQAISSGGPGIGPNSGVRPETVLTAPGGRFGRN